MSASRDSVRLDADLDRVREADPSGSVTEHIVNRTQRSIDALHRAGGITHDQWVAACLLRDNWERARLVAGEKALDMNRVDGIPEGEKQLALWERHKRCLNEAGVGKAHILSAIVLHDGTPASQAIAKPLARLESALDWLSAYCAKGHLDTIE